MGQLSNVQVRAQPLSLRLPDAASTAAIVLDQAMDYCARKMGLPNGGAAVHRLKQGDAAACGYCHYSIARQLGEALGALDANVRAVYMFEYDEYDEYHEFPHDPCPGPGVPITPLHLILLVDRPTEALSALIGGLDRGLAGSLSARIGTEPTASVLDAQVVPWQDVENCTGYGALLASLHNPPLKVWER